MTSDRGLVRRRPPTVTLWSYVAGYLALTAASASLALAAYRLRGALLPGWAGALARLTEVVLGLSVLVVVLELLGTVGWFRPGAAMLAVPAVALALAAWAPRWAGRLRAKQAREGGEGTAAPGGDRSARWMVAVALILAAAVAIQWVVHSATAFGGGARDMDTLRYHGPFAARWVQRGSIVHLEHTSAQNQETFFPGNTELLDAYGILLFGRDMLMPLRNLLWLPVGFLAAWCGGRRFGHGAVAVAGLAAVCSTPLLASIAPGSGKNDIVAVALLLAAAALALHALPARRGPAATGRAARPMPVFAAATRRGGGLPGIEGPPGASAPPSPVAEAPAPEPVRGPADGSQQVNRLALAVAGLAAGLAVGSKLTVLGPLAALGFGVAMAGRHGRWRSLATYAGPALLTGGFWYGRNLAYTGTPLPWFRVPLGVVTLTGPAMPIDDRFGYTVADYAGRAAFWTDFGVPGLTKSFGWVWPLLVAGALVAGLAAVAGRRRPAAARVIGLVSLVAFAGYVVTPWSAGGPAGDPHLFDLDLRFLAPALGLGAVAAARPRLAPIAVLVSMVVVTANLAEPAARPGTTSAAVVLALMAGAGLAVARVGRHRGERAARDHARDRAIEQDTAPHPLGRPGGPGRLDGPGWPGGPGRTRPAWPGHPPRTASLAHGSDWPARVPAPQRRRLTAGGLVAVVVAVGALGWIGTRDYLANWFGRDANLPAAAAYPILRDKRDARVAVGGFANDYALYGVALSNRVQYVGVEGPNAGFRPPKNCREWLTGLRAGRYDYVVLSVSPVARRRSIPPETDWTARDPAAHKLLEDGYTTVYRLDGRPDPVNCDRPARSPGPDRAKAARQAPAPDGPGAR